MFPRWPVFDASEFDILKALIPSYYDETFSLSTVDPRLWATLAQIYGASLPEKLRTYSIALTDTHLPLLQHIPSTSTFSLLTILELPGCPQLTDDVLTTIKSLHTLVAFDASETKISSWGFKKLIMPALLDDNAEDIRSLSNLGPLGLRILRLRNCKAIDHTIFTSLHKLLLLAVIDLRGTSCSTLSIPSPYDKWSSAGLEQSLLSSLYHPSPLTESISCLSNMTSTLHSSTTIFQTHVDSVNRCPIQKNFDRHFGKSQVPRTTTITDSKGGELGGYRERQAIRSATEVEIQDKAFTFIPNAMLSHPPQLTDVSSDAFTQTPTYMLSVAEKESRELADRQAIRDFYAPARHLVGPSCLRKPGYSVGKYYEHFALREKREELFFVPLVSPHLMRSNFADSDRPKKKRRLSDKETTIPSSTTASLLMLYRAPPPWCDIEPLSAAEIQSSKPTPPSSSRPAVTKAAIVNKSRVKMQMIADLKVNVHTAARRRRIGDTMATFDGVKSTGNESRNPRICKDVSETVRPMLQGQNPFRHSDITVNTPTFSLKDSFVNSTPIHSLNKNKGAYLSRTASRDTAQPARKQELSTSPKRPLKPISSVRVPELPPEEMRKLKESMAKPRASLPSSSTVTNVTFNSIRRKSLPTSNDGDIKKLMRQLADTPSSRKCRLDGGSEVTQFQGGGQSSKSRKGVKRKTGFDWKSWGST
ncbi:hypothetical protein J3R30DRAFT_3695617 [Lentinula aciculospora]|uniref:Uncharacterized protein n=1 Tax=Lentinula aciculospora TaxID=153920 RepID=A0A9W9AS90_9AGAR|nr:hypothetical protein J3R30DRAFT_3695617 [Lentinula aciculospora]